jgi:hypothetical protein
MQLFFFSGKAQERHLAEYKRKFDKKLKIKKKSQAYDCRLPRGEALYCPATS